MLSRHRQASLTVVAPDVPALPAGSRLVLSRATRAILGRDPSCALAMTDERVTRRHCAVEWRPGEGWEVQDYGGSNGTFVNQQRVSRQVLAPGDLLTVGRTSLRFAEDLTELEFSEELEAAILDAPEDEGRWLVYADWLQERQNPWGAAMVGRAQQHASLDGLVPFVQTTWTYGTVSRAVVRNQWRDAVLRRAPRVEGVVRELLEAPACRLLQALELDLRSFDLEGDLEATATEVLAAVSELRPNGLRRLRVGPLDGALLSPEVWTAFRAVAAACPRCATRWEDLCVVPRREWLEVTAVTDPAARLSVGQHVALEREQAWRLKRDTSSVHLQRVGPWRVQLLRELPGVTRFPVSGFPQGGELTLAVNGLPCDSANLRDGDVLELAPVARLVFREE